MSTFAERIRAIRTTINMTREEFGESAGIPGRTIEGIENAGRIPRGDVLEAIAKKFPQFAYWLLTQQTDGAQHIAPLIIGGGPDEKILQAEPEANTIYKIIDYVNARSMPACIIKATEFRKIIFIQSAEDESELTAIIQIEQNAIFKNNSKYVVLVKPGGMNFDSEHGGKVSLLNFREYLASVDYDLIEKSQYYEIDKTIFENINRTLEIKSGDLLTPDKSKKGYSRFIAWQKGQAPYDN